MIDPHIQWEAWAWVAAIYLWLFLAWMWVRNARVASESGSSYPGIATTPPGLSRRLRQAGIPAVRSALIQYWAAKVFCSCLAAILVLAIFAIRSLPPSLPGLLGPLAVGFFLPDLMLLIATRRRQAQIRRSTSFLLDLVVALLRAGLPLDRALFRAARDGFPDGSPLADEILQIEGEIGAGRDRGSAFYALADRTGLDELRSLAAAIHIGLRSGAPIEDMLESQADMLRDRRREESVRRLNTSSAFSVVPVILCGLPVFAVVVYFPAFLEILETLKTLRLF
mgnify:CR=1 FL=1